MSYFSRRCESKLIRSTNSNKAMVIKKNYKKKILIFLIDIIKLINCRTPNCYHGVRDFQYGYV